MKTKLIGLLTVFLIGILAVCGIANAGITINDVEFDGTELNEDVKNTLDVERGQEYDVKVIFTPEEDVKDVQVEAYLRGYDHDDRVEDITDVFDAKANITYSKKLNLIFPQRIDTTGYTLRIRVEGKTGAGQTKTYELDVSTGRHIVSIKDVIFSPEGSVQSGRALLASVRVKNEGQKDEDGIKVSVSIPELGVSASDYIDTLDADESTTSEELYLRIPGCSKEGSYEVKTEVTYDDGDEKVTKFSTINVLEDETCGENSGTSQNTQTNQKPTIIYDATAQEVTSGGAGSIYALTISNPTNSAKTVTISVNGVNVFGSARVSPSNVIVIGSGETKTAYVYVTADSKAKAGQYSFTTTVAGLGSTTQEIALTANVLAGKSNTDSLKRALEIGLVVLVIILVILGLIVGFNKMRKSEDESETQTYY